MSQLPTDPEVVAAAKRVLNDVDKRQKMKDEGRGRKNLVRGNNEADVLLVLRAVISAGPK